MGNDNSGGGTYGGVFEGNAQDKALSLTGQTSAGMSHELLTYKPLSSSTTLPTDPVHIDQRSLGYSQGKGLGVALPQVINYSQAQGLPGQWYANDQNFYKQFIGKLITYKFQGANADMGIDGATSAWDNLLQTSIMLNKSSKGKQWTPWDVLETYNHKPGSMGTHKSGDWLIDNATGEKVKYVGPKSKTTKNTAIDLSNPEQVQAIATQTLTQMIGRAPTDKELATFKATLNGYEKSHPAITTTTENYDDQGQVTSTNQSQTGGVDDAARSVVLGEGLKKTKEYGKYQSGTTYFNALMQMIGGG